MAHLFFYWGGVGGKLKKSDTFSICACHPCAGAMLIFSVSFQFLRMTPKGSTGIAVFLTIYSILKWKIRNTVRLGKTVFSRLVCKHRVSLQLSNILVGVVGNISACHADARGSIPRLGVFFSSKQKKSIGPTGTWTRIAGFRVQSDNHYTIGPKYQRYHPWWDSNPQSHP